MIDRRAFLTFVGLSACASSEVGGPDFRGRTLDGATFTKASLKGKSVLVQFWTTWCGFCKRDQPAVEEVVEQYRDKLVVLAVSVGEERATVRQYLEQFPRKARIVLTRDTNLVDVFQPGGFPYYVMLNAEGRVVGEQPGAAGREGLQQLMKLAGV